MRIQDTTLAKGLVRRYLNDVFSRGDLGVIDQYLSGDTFMGGVVDLVTSWRTALPDLRIDVQDVIVEGNKVVTAKKMTGTHTGTYRSSSTGMTVDPTGRAVTWTRLAVRTLRDEKFVDGFWGGRRSRSAPAAGAAGDSGHGIRIGDSGRRMPGARNGWQDEGRVGWRPALTTHRDGRRIGLLRRVSLLGVAESPVSATGQARAKVVVTVR